MCFSFYLDGVMTLYIWIHWFWITVCIKSDACNAIPLSSSLIPTEKQPMTYAPTAHILETIDNGTIPAKSPAKKGHVLAFKSQKVSHDPKENVTVIPLNKVTVIDENMTSPTVPTVEVYTNLSENALNFTYLELENETITTNLDLSISNSSESSKENLSAAGITGITMGCISIVGIICTVSFVIYRNRGFNRPQVLNDRCSNPDSSGYIDDASIRDNSEEMYSLDNDSFLNSLEAMTIQNYWTDTVKHTKL